MWTSQINKSEVRKHHAHLSRHYQRMNMLRHKKQEDRTYARHYQSGEKRPIPNAYGYGG